MATFKRNDDDYIVKLRTGEDLGLLGDFKQRHVVSDVTLVKGGGGVQPLVVKCAIFEPWGYGGHVWVNWPSLKEELQLAPDKNPGDFLWERTVALGKLFNKFYLGNTAFRVQKSFNSGNADEDARHGRCLHFTSLSVSALLLFSCRSAYSANKQKGLLQDCDQRACFQRVFDGLLAYVPKDSALLAVRSTLPPAVRIQSNPGQFSQA